MTALTLYLQEVNASTTLSTANALIENGTTQTGNTNKNTTLASGVTGWGEVTSQGTASAWAAAGSAPSPSGKGWFDDATTLESQHFSSGTWTATVRMNLTSGSVTADIHVRAYQYHSGTYTLIADMVASAQSITALSANYTCTASSVAASSTFATGDKLYIDCVCNITASSSGTTLKIQESTSATQGYVNGAAAASVVTPGYVAGSTTVDKKVGTRFYQYATGIKKIATRFNQYMIADKKVATRFRQVIYQHFIKSRFFQYATVTKKVVTRFTFIAQRQGIVATRFIQFDAQSTTQMLYDDLQVQYIRLRTSLANPFISLIAITYYVSAQVLSEHPVPGELDVLLIGEDISQLHVLRSVKDVSDFIEAHMGAQTLYLQPNMLITAASGSIGPITVSSYKELAIDINLTSQQGTSPTIQFFIDRVGADNISYNLWTSSVFSSAPAKTSKDLGAGLSSQSLGSGIIYRWVITGSSTPGFTYSVSIIGK